MTDEQRKEEDSQVALTVLFVLGWGLPLAGFLWGPGVWWQYLIWFLIGTVVIGAYGHYYEREGGNA